MREIFSRPAGLTRVKLSGLLHMFFSRIQSGGASMLRSFLWNRKRITERLLAKREQIGDNPEGNRRYHKLVTRYQKIILRNYISRHHRSKN